MVLVSQLGDNIAIGGNTEVKADFLDNFYNKIWLQNHGCQYHLISFER